MRFLNLVRMNYKSLTELLPHGYVCFLHFNLVTKLPPPPTPLALPNVAPNNPIMLQSSICQPNFISLKVKFAMTTFKFSKIAFQFRAQLFTKVNHINLWQGNKRNNKKVIRKLKLYVSIGLVPSKEIIKSIEYC